MKPTNDDVVTGTVAVADVHHSKPSAPFQVATEVETNSNPNESQILFIRIAAMFCLIFGLTEIGLGSYVFDYFTGLRAGSWWSAVIVTTSGAIAAFAVTRNTTICTLIIAIIGVLISVAGAAIDGLAATTTGSLVACGYQSQSGAFPAYYGDSNLYAKINSCINNANTDGRQSIGSCYCTDQKGISCMSYTLSASAKMAGKSCADVYTSYPSAAAASSAICAISGLSVLFLSIFSCCGICCREKALFGYETKKAATGSASASATATETQPAFGVSGLSVTKLDSV